MAPPSQRAVICRLVRFGAEANIGRRGRSSAASAGVAIDTFAPCPSKARPQELGEVQLRSLEERDAAITQECPRRSLSQQARQDRLGGKGSGGTNQNLRQMRRNRRKRAIEVRPAQLVI